MSNVLTGIDVSYAQGGVDWETVKLSNTIDFAVIRCGFGSKSDSQIDKQYYSNAQGCIDNEIPFGIYHFAYCTDENNAKNEADFAIELANKYKDNVKFIAYDIEEDTLTYCAKQGTTHTKATLTACAKAFCERVQSKGYQPVLYLNYDFINNRLNYSELADYPLWLAYPDARKAGRDCAIWQYSWTGKLDGISGNVDLDFMYDDIVSGTDSTSTTSAASTASTATVTDSQLNSSKAVNYSVRVTSSDGLNIRSGAGTSYTIKSAVPCGVKLTVTKQTSGGGLTWGYITYNGVTGWIALDYTEQISKIKVGSRVKVKSGATTYLSTVKFSDWVYSAVFTVTELSNDRAVISYNSSVIGAVSTDDLIVQ